MRDRSLINWGGLILLVFVAGAYAAGLSTDFATFAAGARDLVYAISGRTPSGLGLVGYPDDPND